MTKDEIIAAQSELIRKLLRIGMAEMQEAADLFAAIENGNLVGWETMPPPEPQEWEVKYPDETLGPTLAEIRTSRRGWPKGKPRGRRKV